MKISGLFFLLFFCQFVLAQKISNEFFVFQSIISGDPNYDNFDKQVKLVKDAGFAGIEIFELDDFNQKLATIQRHNFKGSFLYAKVDLDERALDPRLLDAIVQLKGSETIICPYIIKKDVVPHQSDKSTNKAAVQLLRKLAEAADQSGLEVAIYPHLNFYVEKTEHAMLIAKKVNRKNLGLTFNLCHWLATSSDAKRTTLKKQLTTLAPFLKMMSINGANNIISTNPNIWDDYILPLGKGNFDTKGLVRFIAVDLGLTIPIGIQCFNLKGDKMLVENTIAAVNDMKFD
jgi:sugar phosphate isomerase/epimerase